MKNKKVSKKIITAILSTALLFIAVPITYAASIVADTIVSLDAQVVLVVTDDGDSPSSFSPINIKYEMEKRAYKYGGNHGGRIRLKFMHDDQKRIDHYESYDGPDAGTYTGFSMDGIEQAPYEIFLKGASHLTRKKTINLDYSMTEIDFTDGGTFALKAGDVDGLLFGDDVINAIDISVLLTDLNSFDLRTDLNRDNIVNAIDLSALLTNLNAQGDT